MKKYLFLLLTLVVTSLAFVSCSDDDDDNQYNSAIVGTWKVTEVKTSQSGSYMDWPFKTTYASFKSDGTYYGSGYFGTGSGTWSYFWNYSWSITLGTPLKDAANRLPFMMYPPRTNAYFAAMSLLAMTANKDEMENYGLSDDPLSIY